MRWVVASIILFLVPYTFITFKYRKTDKAFEPYADMKAQANVNRLLEAGYVRSNLRAERPFPALPAKEITRGASAQSTSAPGGLPDPLDHTLIDAPRLPASYRDLLAPAEIAALLPTKIQFTARIESDHEQLGGAEIYIRDGSVVIVPTFEPIPDGLSARTRDSNVLLTLPAGLLAPGEHAVTLAGAKGSLRWNVRVK
ncbi:MAG: hypothetical protein RL376_1218 [Verrucomicrobiota bacterium]